MTRSKAAVETGRMKCTVRAPWKASMKRRKAIWQEHQRQSHSKRDEQMLTFQELHSSAAMLSSLAHFSWQDCASVGSPGVCASGRGMLLTAVSKILATPIEPGTPHFSCRIS
jgi:hypothetical protein